MLLDEASRPAAAAAAPSLAGAPKRERDEAPAADARGAAGGGPAKRAAAPSLSFGPGVAAAAARVIQAPAVAAAAAEQVRRLRLRDIGEISMRYRRDIGEIIGEI